MLLSRTQAQFLAFLRETARNSIIKPDHGFTSSLYNVHNRLFSSEEQVTTEHRHNRRFVQYRCDLRLSDDSPLPIDKIDIPWPISSPIYGDGWKSYGKLMWPSLEANTGRFLSLPSQVIIEYKELNRFINKLNYNSLSDFIVAKRKDSKEYLLANFDKSRKVLFQYCVVIADGTRCISNQYVSNGKAKEYVNNACVVIVGKTKELQPFVTDKTTQILSLIRDKIKENKDIVSKISSTSSRTKTEVTSLLKYIKTHGSITYLKSKENLEKHIKDFVIELSGKSKELSDKTMRLLPETELIDKKRDLIIKSMVVSNKILEGMNFGTKYTTIVFNSSKNYCYSLIQLMRKFDDKPPNHMYVDKYFSRSEAKPVGFPSLTVVKSETSEAMPLKHDFHTSAFHIDRPISLSFHDFPDFLIGMSNLQTGTLLKKNESLKKIWIGLRDKTLPNLQGTIASLLQKVQGSLIKKKK